MFKLFSKRKKFSKENLVHQCTLLEKNPKIHIRNKQLVIETLRQIAELMIWGDQNDDSFFHIVAERNVLGCFLSIVEQKFDRSVVIQVMQTLSIMIQNITKQQSLYYLFSNNYINDLVVHEFDFTDNEILAYYVSFLKTISLKLDENVINFFFNAKAHDFPLYSEALKFFKNEDQMVRIAVRTLTLNVFGVDDPDLRTYITDKSAVPYFSNLTWFIRDQCIVLNETLNKAMNHGSDQDHDPDSDKLLEHKEHAASASSSSSSSSSSSPQPLRDRSPSLIEALKKTKSKSKLAATPDKPSNASNNAKIQKTPTNQLQRGVEEQVDHYYYLEDIFLLGLRPLSEKLMNQVLSHLVLPVLVGSLVEVDDLLKVQQRLLQQFDAEMDRVDSDNRVQPMMANSPMDADDQHDAKYEEQEQEQEEQPPPPQAPQAQDRQPTEPTTDKLDSVDALGSLVDMNKSTSMLEVGDDDTQKASAIRKFLQRRTRISKQLALFLLTQVLTVFSDGSLINAIIVALMHPYPPKLVNQIVLKPPQHAVESSIPIAAVLCQKRSYRRDSNASSTSHSQPSTPKTDVMDAKTDFNGSSEPHTNSKRSERMQRILENDEQNKIQRSHIESVEKIDIIEEDSKQPEDINMYRNELLQMLASDPTLAENEQLIASAAALLLTILRNKSTSEVLLVDAGICPQKKKRKRQLFTKHAAYLNSNNVSSSSYATQSAQSDRRGLLPEHEALPSMPLPSPNIPIPASHSNSSNAANASSPPKNGGGGPHAQSSPHAHIPLSSALPSPLKKIPDSRVHAFSDDAITANTANANKEEDGQDKQRSSSLPDVTKLTHAQQQQDKHVVDSKISNAIAPTNVNTKLSVTTTSTAATCDYPFEFVECLLNVLSQCSKLSVFTIRVLCDLLIDFVQDRTMKNNGLSDQHYDALTQVWRGVKQQIDDFLPLESPAMDTYFIDTFEEEWRSLGQQPRIETLIANPIRILPPHVFHGQLAAKAKRLSDTDVDTDTETETTATTHMVQTPPSTRHEKEKEKEVEQLQQQQQQQQQPEDVVAIGNGNTNANGNIERPSEGTKSSRVDCLFEDQEQLIRKLERIRKSIHNFLHIARLKTELLGGTVALPFVPRTEFQYYYRLQVPLSTIAPGCLNCLVLPQAQQKRRRVLFSIREPDWLLLFNRMKGRAGFAMVYMAIPIHSIEGHFDKYDPRVVHLFVRSTVRPHDVAAPISTQKNKWRITLFFDAMFDLKSNANKSDNSGSTAPGDDAKHKDALTALDYINMNRQRVRRKMLAQITDLVHDEPLKECASESPQAQTDEVECESMNMNVNVNVNVIDTQT